MSKAKLTAAAQQLEERRESEREAATTMGSYSAVVSALQILLERWWLPRPPVWKGNAPHAVRSNARKGITVHGRPPRHSTTALTPEPWWEQSKRLRLLQRLKVAVDHGEHESPSVRADASPMAVATLLVRKLLTSSRQGPLAQAEAMACACTLAGLCSSQPEQVVTSCGGLLEQWAVERLNITHGANTEISAELELYLIELLKAACAVPAAKRHLRAMPLAGRVLGRLRQHEILGERVRNLLKEIENSEQQLRQPTTTAAMLESMIGSGAFGGPRGPAAASSARASGGGGVAAAQDAAARTAAAAAAAMPLDGELVAVD